ncbi:hypothetical protein DXG01_012063 [Tephrocybe rancida]|nr:hypothetical protein DXG01_012063 [Tephrocybe rancida]
MRNSEIKILTTQRATPSQVPRRGLATQPIQTKASTVSSRASSPVSGGLANHLKRGTASAAAIRPLAPGDEPPLHVAEVSPDDLPIVSLGDGKVAIGWDTRTWSRFHNIWLRDHCRCPECFHPVTKQRLLDTFSIPHDITPVRVDPKIEGLEVSWPSTDSHISLYPWSWLQRNSYDPIIHKPDPANEKILWGSRIEQSPPTVTYEEAMHEDDQGLFKWLSNITDPCGLQLFHLLSHTEGSGGASFLVDGFYAASVLKDVHPEAYEVLSKVHVPAHAAGESSVTYRPNPPTGYPVLRHDPVTGELSQVRWNNDDRSAMNHLDPRLVDECAIRAWNKCLTSADSEFWLQLQPGTAVVFDNYRVLHGRSAFTGKRRMCGAYVGGDEYRSKLAVLTERFAPDAVLRATNDLSSAVTNGRNIWNSAL